jgi:TrmH family RNA methyltransferase
MLRYDSVYDGRADLHGNTMNTETLTSPKNPLLRDIRRAVLKGSLTADGYCVAESFHLLEEALRSESHIEAVLAAASVRTTVERHVKGLKRVRVIVVADDLFEEISATESSQGVITLVKAREWTLDQLFAGRTMAVVLDGIQDPGNAGAIVRAAEAFGASGVLFVKGTVSPFNPKTLRASAGSLFRLPFATGIDPALARAAMEQKRLDVWAAHPRAQKSLVETDLTRRFALIVGSEGHGVSEKLRGCATDVRIVTMNVESLNAAMAAGIILHEASRQRMVTR